MKPGTRFKIECVMTGDGYAVTALRGQTIDSLFGESLRAHAIDVIEPRERFTLPTGAVVERLNKGEEILEYDLVAYPDGRIALASISTSCRSDGVSFYRTVKRADAQKESE